MRSSVLTFIAWIAAAGVAAAQPSPLRLTLDEALSKAVEASHRLGEVRARQQAADATVEIRRRSDDPTLTASAGYTRTNHIDEFGVPQFAIEDMFPGTRFMRLGREQIDVERGRGGTVRDYRQILRTAAKDKKQWPGSQAQMRRYLTQQARQVLPRGKKRKRRR